MSIQDLQSLRDSHPYVRLAILFGSVARGTARFDSDIDLALLGDEALTSEQTLGLIEEVSQLTGRPVDIIDLHGAGEPLLGEILQHGHKLFGSTPDMAALMQRHVYANEDFVPYVQRMLEERNRQWLHS